MEYMASKGAPDDRTYHTHCCENLRSYVLNCVVISACCSPVHNGVLCFASGCKSIQRQIEMKLPHSLECMCNVCCVLFMTSCKNLSLPELSFGLHFG